MQQNRGSSSNDLAQLSYSENALHGYLVSAIKDSQLAPAAWFLPWGILSWCCDCLPTKGWWEGKKERNNLISWRIPHTSLINWSVSVDGRPNPMIRSRSSVYVRWSRNNINIRLQQLEPHHSALTHTRLQYVSINTIQQLMKRNGATIMSLLRIIRPIYWFCGARQLVCIVLDSAFLFLFFDGSISTSDVWCMSRHNDRSGLSGGECQVAVAVLASSRTRRIVQWNVEDYRWSPYKGFEMRWFCMAKEPTKVPPIESFLCSWRRSSNWDALACISSPALPIQLSPLLQI